MKAAGEPEECNPYKKLCVAILLRAIQDFFILRSKVDKPKDEIRVLNGRHSRQGLGLYCEIERYFYDRTLDREPFSFQRLCEILSDDPESTRRKILQFLQNSEFKSFYHTRRGAAAFASMVGDFLAAKNSACQNISSTSNYE